MTAYNNAKKHALR